jgi:hypothetical protein
MSGELSRRLAGLAPTVLIAVCAAVGCGGSSQTVTKTLTKTVTASGAPASQSTVTTSPPGTSARAFLGATSQGLPISFVVTPTSVVSIRFAWRATCADHQMHQNTILFPGAPITAGAFSASGTLNTGASSSVFGHVNGSAASGRLSRSGPSSFGTSCLDAGVTWTAYATG